MKIEILVIALSELFCGGALLADSFEQANNKEEWLQLEACCGQAETIRRRSNRLRATTPAAFGPSAL
jgi:hypothetical protein